MPEILLNLIDGYKNQITTVARQGNDELQRGGDFMDENDR